MQIVSKKYHQFVICWISPESSKGEYNSYPKYLDIGAWTNSLDQVCTVCVGLLVRQPRVYMAAFDKFNTEERFWNCMSNLGKKSVLMHFIFCDSFDKSCLKIVLNQGTW